ncbi:MAG TPA: peptidoglycan DD-metalloendopeptidase family protein [Kofleriaceae bacterium]|nr:peptidoglycan DD-metalloendopeptidase family protein [Kofleriaceae bacterium]
MAPARRGTIRLTLVLGVLVVVNLYVFLWRKGTSIPDVQKQANALGSSPLVKMPTPPPPPMPAAPPQPNSIKEGKVEKGDTIGRLLKREGLAPADSDDIIRALHDVFDYKSLRAGQKYTIERAPDGHVVSFELSVSKTERVKAARGADGAMAGTKAQDQTRSEVQDVGGRVTDSLYASMKAAGEKTELVEAFADLFAYDLDFYVDVHDGDTFKAVVEKTYKDQELIGYGKIIAAEWNGKAGHFRAFLWKGKWYDGDGHALEKTLLKTPLKFARVSSGFDLHRMHPILHTERAHMGVDYAAPVGTPVWAAANGVVESAAPAGGAGNLIVLRHDGGLETFYMHLSKFAKGLKPGQRVAAKTVIGYVGTTGLSTGPHLHFGVKKDGSYVDPLKLAPQRGAGVPSSQRPQFLADTAGVAARLDHIVLPSADAPTLPSQGSAAIAP